MEKKSHQTRIEEAREFCQKVMFESPLTQYEYDSLTCNVEAYEELRIRDHLLRKKPSGNESRLAQSIAHCQEALSKLNLTGDEMEDLACGTEKNEERDLRRRMKEMVIDEVRIEEEGEEEEEDKPSERERERREYVVKMEGTESEIVYVIDNYVHVTYFVNSLTGKPCNFNLVALALKLINYYVEYSCKKFAKVNFRYYQGSSHLLYKSSVVVETGSDNQSLSRRLLKNTMRILRKYCDYPHLNIGERSCQNIVAAGKFSDSICVNVMKKKFQEVDYDEEKFPGVVIRQDTLKKYNETINDCSDSDEEGLEEGERVISGGFVITKDYRDDDDDSGLIREINLPSTVPVANREAKEAIIEIAGSEGYMVDKCASLGFPEGQIINTGCKTEEEVTVSMILLIPILHECRASDPANKKLENDLRKKKNILPSESSILI